MRYRMSRYVGFVIRAASVFALFMAVGLISGEAFADNQKFCDPATSNGGTCPASCSTLGVVCTVTSPGGVLRVCNTALSRNCDSPAGCPGVNSLGFGCTCSGPGGSC